jgi:16S rRNA (guanine527-N7)-methyltransferase
VSSSPTHEAGIAARLELAGGATVSATLIGRLATYLDLLARWNRRINLTGFDLTPPADNAIDRLIVEPVLAARHVRAEDRFALDVGSGNGSPAIPLILAAPWLQMTMVEARQRRSSFLRSVLRELLLVDAVVDTMRISATSLPADTEGRMNVVTVRAVRLDDNLWQAVRRLLGPGGRAFVFGGADATPEWYRATTLGEPLLSQKVPLVGSAVLTIFSVR